jgi:hypothetical protein
MDDDDRYIQAGDGPALSMPAFQLHTFALIDSVQRGAPGFVSDDYLNSISAETTVSAIELETSGLWARRDGGYFINDPETINTVLSFNEKQDAGAAECLARGYHLPHPEKDGSWEICATCHAPTKRPDGKPAAGIHGEAPPRAPRGDGLDQQVVD